MLYRRLNQRAGGQGEAGAGVGNVGAGSGAIAVGAGRGAGFFFWAAGGVPPAGCNSTNTGFGTRRGSSPPSGDVTARTGTVCG